ncbi:tRNA N(3)-cytidine methyltransferase METTL2-like isoform X2 [Babylonia areolata]|uniref:tRNA N(3)-cytidine methyltransferase METTL2-like isoform X2 n=1 Tax=Babylonia areolata TaxID=304850 RepID=UPI003FD40D36
MNWPFGPQTSTTSRSRSRDNVVWDEEQESEARQKTMEQLQDALPAEKQEEYEREADLYWDKFYNQHQNRFFKDRHWLFTEFPELYSSQGNTDLQTPNMSDSSHTTTSVPPLTVQHQSGDGAECSQGLSQSIGETGGQLHSGDVGISVPSVDGQQNVEKTAENDTDRFPGESATFRILEVGCGVGNTVFPVLSTNNDPGLMMYCCDFSSTAVQLVKDHRDYDPRRCHAFEWDITDENSTLPFPPESLDIVIMIFVLSAVHPEKMQKAVNRLASCLKPGGQILLRDYGRYDMAQLRFKKGRCLSENFYVRGDGTRVYFFTQEEFRSMFHEAGLEEVQNLIDRRLQVNRGRQLKMYRVWIQCKYRKPVKGTSSAEPSS